ncbi:MAG: TatD family hydrolase [Spirochaetia bacterium]
MVDSDDIHIIPGSVDSHFHTLIMEEKSLPAPDILRTCFDAGLAYGLDIAVSLDDFEQRRQRLTPFPHVYLTAGFHPSQAGSRRFPEVESELRRRLSDPRVVALGEVGLDFYRNHGTPAEQADLVVSQIELANEYSLPLIIHNREAASELYDLFRAHPPIAESVMHCFSADADTARRFLDLGFTISFGGNVTYKRSEPIREAARLVPADRILTETDAPFLAPQAVRGKPNHPGYVGYTYEFLATLRGETSTADLVSHTKKNFERIFSVVPSR